MSVSLSEPGRRLALERGSVAVCVPVTAAPDLLYRCFRGLLAHTPADVPLVVVEDETDADPAVERFLSEIDRDLHHVRLSESSGEVALARTAISECGEADVVLLASHALVFDGWFDRLRRAARSDTTVATASALGNSAGPLSVIQPDERLPEPARLERLAADIAARSPRALPRTPTADGHCIWVPRAALELAGPLDPAFATLRAAVIDFAQRCVLQGLVNVAADDVFVPSVAPDLPAHQGPLSIGDDVGLLERRYPYLRRTLEEGIPSPLSRSVALARQSLRGLSVTIDARILRGTLSGVQIETLELIETLCRAEDLRLRIVLDPAISGDALEAIQRLPERVERLSADQVGADLPRTDVVHRPYQVTSADDLDLLRLLGERIVIKHLDLIAYHNPGYFASPEGWRQFRRVTRHALAMADRVIFSADHAVEDAISEGLVERDRVRIIPMAVDRPAAAPEQRRPSGAPERPFLLCIGNDFRHKNRLFAIRLLEELRDRGWEGRLALVGAHVDYGSSAGEEAAYLATRPETAELVHELSAVDEAEKTWLYANADALVYPTVYEGFGLVPFEAARASTACLFAPQAALAETLPPEAAVLVPWDPAASADRALPLLGDGEERRRHIELVTEAAGQMKRGESAGEALLAVYEEAARAPFREASAFAAEAQSREADLAKWVDLEENMGALVGPDAYLPPEVQRALLSLARRRWLRRPLFALLRGLYRLGRGARRSEGPPASPTGP